MVKEIFLFFTSFVLENIVTESNRYAQECKGKLFATWQPITIEELLAYMGFMILMGTVQLPRIEDHWKKDAIYHYTPMANRMSCERFKELHIFLHFANNKQQQLSSTRHSGTRQAGQIDANQSEWLGNNLLQCVIPVKRSSLTRPWYLSRDAPAYNNTYLWNQ